MLTVIKKAFKSYRGLWLVTVAITLFSTIEVLSKFVQPEVTPMVLAFVRFSLGGITLAILLPFRHSSLPKGAIIEHWKGLAGFGTLGIGLTFILFHWGISITRAANAAVIFSANPTFVAILALLLWKKKMPRWFFLSPLFAFLGLFLVGTQLFNIPEGIALRDFLFGNFLMLLSAVVWAAVYTLKGEEYVHLFGPLRTALFGFSIGVIPLFLAIPFFKENLAVLWHLSVVTWVYLVFLGVIATGIGHWLFFEGLKEMEAARVTTPFYLKPVIAPFLAWLLLGEQILANWEFIVGVALLFFAIIFAQIKHGS